MPFFENFFLKFGGLKYLPFLCHGFLPEGGTKTEKKDERKRTIIRYRDPESPGCFFLFHVHVFHGYARHALILCIYTRKIVPLWLPGGTQGDDVQALREGVQAQGQGRTAEASSFTPIQPT